MDERAPLANYYRNPSVRARIREYCGLERGGRGSCVFVSAAFPADVPPTGWSLDPRFPPDDLDALLDRGADIFRSTWDRDSLPFCIDVDYLNATLLGHAFARPDEAFARLEPTYAVVVELLRDYGIETLALMTGKGYQFTGRVPLDSPVIHELADLVPDVPDWHDTLAARLPPWIADRLAAVHSRAYVATGMAAEYLAHQVIRRGAPRSPIPLVLNGTQVGIGPTGRDAVSIDLSFAGDPLDVRHMRVAFGGYQQHRFRPDIYGAEVAALGPLITVPRRDTPLDAMLSGPRQADGAARLAEGGSAHIPVSSTGLRGLIAEYRQSPLARFHQSFSATRPHGPEAWPDTYDRLQPADLPPCVAAPLLAPNDMLLKPEHLQHVTRFLLSEGWAPSHVAGLVWSRYARDFAWGDRWTYLSPRARAEFDVRVFAGMVRTGLDRGVDFNCRSAQEKGLCPSNGCPHDLRVSRDRLLADRE